MIREETYIGIYMLLCVTSFPLFVGIWIGWQAHKVHSSGWRSLLPNFINRLTDWRD